MGRFFSVERGGCMGISLSDEIRQLLDRANFAHLATLMPDGSPQSVPVWIGRDGDRIIVCTGENSLAQIRGRVVERRPDPDLKVMHPISRKYVGKPYTFRSPDGPIALVIVL